MSKFFIENPGPNISENLFRFSTDYKYQLLPSLRAELKTHGILPATYPRAIDLASGDGGVAAFLVELGWQSENITCVDRLQASYPAVEGLVWLYIDLEVMALKLSAQNGDSSEMDPRLSVLKGGYDLMTCSFSNLSDEHLEILKEFFLEPHGIAIINGLVKK